MTTIYWAGDSTVAFNSILTYPQTGIGQQMYLFLKPGVQVANHAINGRSTKSFLDEGRLDCIAALLGKGDFLFIQFGHNDEKVEDPNRYTTPFGTYKENLNKYIDCALEKKAFPVLISPIERRCFEDNRKLGAGKHGAYVEAMYQVAEDRGIPCIHLYERSRELLDRLGPESASKLHISVPAGIYPNFPEGKDDATHLCPQGAVCYASYIADGLKALGGVYEELVLERYCVSADHF